MKTKPSPIFIFLIYLISTQLNAQGHYQEILRFKNDQIQAIITYNAADILDGVAVYYHPNGLERSILNYVNGKANGTIEDYYPNGNLERIGFLFDDKAEGVFEYYYPNEQRKYLILYRDNKIVDIEQCFDQRNNKLYCGKLKDGNGFINNYNTKGILIGRDVIANGVLVEHINLAEDKK